MMWRFYYSGHLLWEYIPKVSDSFWDDLLLTDLPVNEIFSISVVENEGD